LTNAPNGGSIPAQVAATTAPGAQAAAFATLYQGEGAPTFVVKALAGAASGAKYDVVDVVRSGGGPRWTGSFLVYLDVPFR
jgi:hypothetical protein